MSAAVAHLVMASDNPALVAEAEKHTLDHLANVPEGQGRSRLFGQIRLARIRFLAGEAEQASDAGDQALDVAEHVSSAMIRVRLRELMADSEPYADVSRVVEFRDRLHGAIAGLN